MKKKKHLEWLDLKRPPVERLESFRQWVARLLYRKLHFSSHDEVAARQIGQCESIVMQTVAELEKYHFRLEGQALKSWIEAKVDHIAQAQRKNQVHNLYMYFKRSWSVYVGQQAEELKEQTRSAVYEAAIKGVKTIPELEFIVQKERLKASLRKRKTRADKSAAAQRQQKLF